MPGARFARGSGSSASNVNWCRQMSPSRSNKSAFGPLLLTSNARPSPDTLTLRPKRSPSVGAGASNRWSSHCATACDSKQAQHTTIRQYPTRGDIIDRSLDPWRAGAGAPPAPQRAQRRSLTVYMTLATISCARVCKKKPFSIPGLCAERGSARCGLAARPAVSSAFSGRASCARNRWDARKIRALSDCLLSRAPDSAPTTLGHHCSTAGAPADTRCRPWPLLVKCDDRATDLAVCRRAVLR